MELIVDISIKASDESRLPSDILEQIEDVIAGALWAFNVRGEVRNYSTGNEVRIQNTPLFEQLVI